MRIMALHSAPYYHETGHAGRVEHERSAGEGGETKAVTGDRKHKRRRTAPAGGVSQQWGGGRISGPSTGCLNIKPQLSR